MSTAWSSFAGQGARPAVPGLGPSRAIRFGPMRLRCRLWRFRPNLTRSADRRAEAAASQLFRQSDRRPRRCAKGRSGPCRALISAPRLSRPQPPRSPPCRCRKGRSPRREFRPGHCSNVAISGAEDDLAGARRDWQRIGQLAPGSQADMAARANIEHLESNGGTVLPHPAATVEAGSRASPVAEILIHLLLSITR